MIEIRPVETNSGLTEVCDIISSSQKEESKKSGVLFNTRGLTAEMLKEELTAKQGVCFCAYQDQRPAGTLSVFTESRQSWYASGSAEKIIKYVAVAPEHQGRHVATEMVEFVKDRMDYDVLSVSTSEKNRHAIHLYEKCGFQLMHISRGPIHNAYKFAYWKNGCPITKYVIKWHVESARLKCFVKKIVSRPSVSKDMFL